MYSDCSPGWTAILNALRIMIENADRRPFQLMANAPQISFRSNKQSAVGHGIRGQRAFAQFIFGQQFKNGARLDHESNASLVLKINPARRKNRRRRKITAQPFAPVNFSGARVEARGNARV